VIDVFVVPLIVSWLALTVVFGGKAQ